MNGDGSIDVGFDSSSITSAVISVAANKAGRIAITAPGRDLGNGLYEHPVFLLTSSGALDPSFNSGSGGNYGTTCLGVQPDGKLLVAGEFGSFSGVPASGLVRLNNDGSLDPKFTFSGHAAKYVYGLDFAPDGKLLITGSFFMTNGAQGLALLWSDGSPDTNYFGQFPNVAQAAFQKDGRILVLGGAQPRRLFGESAWLNAFVPATHSVQFQVPIARTYCLWASPDLLAWQPLATNSASSALVTFQDSTAPSPPTRFYRITLLP